MSPFSSRWPVCLLVVGCLMAGSSLSQECSAEKMENAIVDINLSLPEGVRGAEPVYTSTPEACVRACCSEEKLSGDKKCNLMIFNAQRTSTHPNCYLFYCPSTEACPMKSAIGYVSYKITRETPATEDTSFKNEVFSSNGYSLSSDAGAFISSSHTSPHSPTTALQQLVFHQASELPNSVTKHLDNSDFHTAFPGSQRTKHPESLDPTSGQKVINLPSNKSAAVQIGNPSTSFPTTQSSVSELSSTTLTPLTASTSQLESHTTSLPIGGTKPTALTITTAAFLPTGSTKAKPDVPDTTFAVTRVPLSSPTTSASTTTTKWVTTNFTSATTPSGLRTPTIPHEPTVVSPNDTSQVTLLSSSGPTLSTSNSPTASQSNPEGYDLSDSESYLPEGILREKGVNQLGEKSSLIAALLFEVIFLLLVIALTGKKIHESLQKRPYTRLDYLINGMYADV
ncbi:MANSC domain-containing protein 1 [Apus apus]|uniref:MANSC domain-containing protein 1 n=1 Tax=Apus apus TaxID=8895 RepID=UPI0021F91BDA|nr:MANSC domain-containing protein 1 [Apus apus]